MQFESAATNVAQARALEWIDTHEQDIVGFLQELVRIPSVNPWFQDEPELSHEDRVQAVIASRLEPLGATIDLWEPDAEALSHYQGRPGYYPGRRFAGRPNLAARLPSAGTGQSLLLTGHIDVVKAGTGWTTAPFGGEVHDGRIYGRGTADMKGGVAAMIMATEAVFRSGLRPGGTITIGTVVDEEAGGMGTLAFIDRGYRADGCIMTEPTNLDIAPLCRGILWGKLIIHGRSGHIEMPQGDWRTGGAVDAIERARLYLDHFKRLNADWAWRKIHPLLPIPCQVLVAQLHAGEYPTAFANRAEVVFNVQYLPSERDEFGLGGRVKREIETFVTAVAQTDSWLRDHPPDIEWLIDADCGETPADDAFVQVCCESLSATGRPPVIQGICSHTDMGWFVNRGIPTINFGPGQPRTAHQNDEHIQVADLLDVTRMIATTIVRWCGVTEGA